MVDAKPSPFYITTAIDYPNGAPHIGHSLEKIAADVVARYHRLLGDDTAFCMGLDENSQHIVTAAADNGVSPSEWVDRMDVAFRRAWDALDISRQRLGPHHRSRATPAPRGDCSRRAQANGDIYKATYAGWYCPNCNNYYTDDELVNGHCPHHPTITPEWLEEENYFFALSKYTDLLLEHLEENPDFITPAVWRPEMLGLLRVRPDATSRSRAGSAPDREPWGIPVPGDPEPRPLRLVRRAHHLHHRHRLPGRPGALQPLLAGRLPGHRQGHHALPLPLLAGDAALRRAAAAAAGSSSTASSPWKASASPKPPGNMHRSGRAGRRVRRRPGPLLPDARRLVRVRRRLPRANLIRRYNDDLGNDLGNLLNRVVAMIGRYRQGKIPTPGDPGDLELDLRGVAESARTRAAAQIESWDTRRRHPIAVDARPPRQPVPGRAPAVAPRQATRGGGIARHRPLVGGRGNPSYRHLDYTLLAHYRKPDAGSTWAASRLRRRLAEAR